jgi:hypothetical protein
MDVRFTPAGLPAAPAGESLLRWGGHEASLPGDESRGCVTTSSTQIKKLAKA